jgi:hypothetical protein
MRAWPEYAVGPLVESAAILDADDLVDDDRRLVPRTGPIRRAVLSDVRIRDRYCR